MYQKRILSVVRGYFVYQSIEVVVYVYASFSSSFCYPSDLYTWIRNYYKSQFNDLILAIGMVAHKLSPLQNNT
jgi:hypothetical protein